jgi:cardiolipin synthase
MEPSAKLLLPRAYIKDVTARIRQAKNRISIISMVVANDTATDDFIDALAQAAERGVDVAIAADIFTYGELGGFFLPTRYRSKKSRESTMMGRRFRKSGVRFSWLGKSQVIVASGRTHMKWCVVDDMVYSFGGVNLYEQGINNNDFIIRIQNQDLADRLFDEYNHIVKADAGGYSNRSHKFTINNNKILIDGGVFFDSIIYRQACKLAEESFRIRLVSQYCPTGKLGRLIRQTNSELYFNPPANASAINRIIISVGMFLSGNKTLYKKRKYLHAKFMIFETHDGRKVAITGSHNFVFSGVVLGTKEIALRTEDPAIIEQLENFLTKKVI